MCDTMLILRFRGIQHGTDHRSRLPSRRPGKRNSLATTGQKPILTRLLFTRGEPPRAMPGASPYMARFRSGFRLPQTPPSRNQKNGTSHGLIFTWSPENTHAHHHFQPSSTPSHTEYSRCRTRDDAPGNVSFVTASSIILHTDQSDEPLFLRPPHRFSPQGEPVSFRPRRIRVRISCSLSLFLVSGGN